MWNTALVAARLLEFSGALTLFGSPLFYLYAVEKHPAPALARWHWARRLLVAAATLALLGTVLWVMAETASISGESRDALRPAALWIILADTRFGRACVARLALLGLSLIALLVWARTRGLCVLLGLMGAAVVASFAWTGHGASGLGSAGTVHLGADLLHLWAAGIWLGALPPLVLLAMSGDARALHHGLVQFSRLGLAVVAMLILSGLVNSWFLIGPAHWRSLFNAPYGLALLVKLALFVGMLALAARHRFQLTPALDTELRETRSSARVVGMLRSSLLTEIGLALGVVLAVSLLGTLAPPAAGE